MTKRSRSILAWCSAAAVIGFFGPVGVFAQVPDDDSSFVAQMTLDANTGSIQTVFPNFKNMGAVDHAADWASYTADTAAGSLDGTPANSTAALAQGAVNHTADFGNYTVNASAGSIDATPANSTADQAQGAVDHYADAANYSTNATAGSITGLAANATAALAQGALDYTDEFNSMVVDPVSGSIVTPEPYSTYVQKVTPTLAFWGALILAAGLLYGLVTLFRRNGRLQEPA
jgi:hypothetical protein